MSPAEALAGATDDEVVAEMQRRLERGTVGFGGLLSPHQLDHLGAWHRVCCLSADWSNAPGQFDQPLIRQLRELILDCAGSVQIPPGIYAVNTTFLGRQALEDHAPRAHTEENQA